MSKKTSYLIGISLTIIIGTLLYCYLCNDCYCCGEKIDNEVENNMTVTPEIKATMHPLAIKDSNGDFNFNSNDNLNFRTSNFLVLEPISNDVNQGILKLKEYLLANPLKSVGITGYYSSEEKNNSAFPNLGLARANSAKNYLVSTGIPSRHLDTSGELNDDLLPDANGIYYGPLLFDIFTIEEGDTSHVDAINALGETIRANPLILYFDTGAATINLTAKQRLMVANISRYIDKVDDARIQVIGYTDNTGDRFSNIKLGQNRADFVKRYFVGNAIPDVKINTSSKGPDEPIADNATEVGRTKNRRVVVTIN